ncbi:arginase [Haloarcula salina]|uniref:Arginase n=1 Tax=Haloarcula salina TaxID=1429914 RepID=A0AA41KJW9_9EURY|nr:arginase [Haloarcula salina]MBV0901314.1 arginase [Haloarcula salina]
MSLQSTQSGDGSRTAPPVTVLGVPFDLGADRHGVDMGPSAIRYGGLSAALDAAGVDYADAGDLAVPTLRTRADEATDESDAKHLDGVAEMTETLADRVDRALGEGTVPLVLGGDHSIAMGTMRGAARAGPLGVVWFDAHGDYNTPTSSPSGNVHGMPLAAAHGYGDFAEMPWATASNVVEENTVIVGARSLDRDEQAVLRDSDMSVFTMSDIDSRGIGPVVEEALDIATDGVDGVHVSLDLDWLDPEDAPGVGTPVPGGVTYREAHTAMERVADRDAAESALRSLDVVEVNPVLDTRNETGEKAASLAATALGKQIL